MIWYYIGLTASHLLAALLGAFVFGSILMYFGERMARKEARARKAIVAELKRMEQARGCRGYQVPDGMGTDGKPYKEES